MPRAGPSHKVRAEDALTRLARDRVRARNGRSKFRSMRQLAEAGCSSHEIMSVSGHETLKEVERYTKTANRALLANSAIAALKSAQDEAAETEKRASGLANTPEIVSQSSGQAHDSKEKKNRGWRSGRDSNPRYGFSTVQRFSKPPPSASRPPLQRQKLQ